MRAGLWTTGPGTIRCPMLGGMTPTPRPAAGSPREQQALRLFAEHPMDDGLHQDLRTTDVDLLPVRSLPAS